MVLAGFWKHCPVGILPSDREVAKTKAFIKDGSITSSVLSGRCFRTTKDKPSGPGDPLDLHFFRAAVSSSMSIGSMRMCCSAGGSKFGVKMCLFVSMKLSMSVSEFTKCLCRN